MTNPFARAVCRLAAIAASAAAFYQYSWMPEHADHVLKTLQTRTQTALDSSGDRAIFAARDNIELLQTIPNAGRLSVDYHLIYAVNARILGRKDEAIEHYNAALTIDHRPGDLLRSRHDLSRRAEARRGRRRHLPGHSFQSGVPRHSRRGNAGAHRGSQ